MRTIDPRGPAARRAAVAGLALVLAATSAVAATYTPLFAAGDIRLDAPDGMTRAEVLAVARVTDRSNVFHLDAGAVEQRLERDPRIVRATVTTSLPNRIAIEVVPRTAVGIVGADGGLVGADGVVIGPAGSATGLPDLMTAEAKPVDGIDLLAAAATADALGPALRRQVDAVIVATDGTVRVRLAAGFAATFGDATELDAKAVSLAALLEWMREEGVTIVSADVTVPGSPTAQLERGSKAVPVP
ncbi:MAG: domain, FtsQ-type [Actinomycetia bacterium]|jgi:cell division septal protein FtsQ|nr:domain, FtsQ-type [Actinomycetes bacterium]